MTTHLQQELEVLKENVLTMVSEVKQSLQKVCKAFALLDADLAQEVIESDQDINESEVKIDEQALRLLALEGPVARDLRFILGCMRIAVDLERIGDECANIAEATIMLSCKPVLGFYERIQVMGEKSARMLDLAVSSFFQPNADLAIDVCKMDYEIDELNSQITKYIIQYMTEETPAIERSVQAINITRRFERIADLATNIAESAVFVDKGINIKHYCQFDNR
ncbi:phosphate uptake regulator, PhoU [Desulfonauticus submarinus]|uniref:Phosphate-specific transport system accessory protein PhoU n=1 Tax=Desulfonauticus submarinus TaxID=206665 RepID=A0A1H0ESN0_9BACT|nr:phosphate signaling complex protein PhoU [Desulfonauticus submarinus]SDN85372.1 phosphate uptake regulator, PhoU [Desulfonauticus submarinus]